MQIPDTISILSKLLDKEVLSAQRIGGGLNSQVYRLICENHELYVAKYYFRDSDDTRDRLGTEFSGLTFLWGNGVKRIPQPIAVDRDAGCAVYEYIEGNAIPSQEVTSSDIDYAVEFLTILKGLNTVKGSRNLPPASEACFSVQSIVDNIYLRLDRLQALPDVDSQYHALQEFLSNEFSPSIDEVIKWCKSNLDQAGLSYITELDVEERTLSPSDFGFHNALRRSDGQIVFLDFEYFGWDDPAKMISDFLLHPAMELEDDLKQRFFIKAVDCFRAYKYVDKRVRIVYPLFSFKWCLIILNEFVPQDLRRRSFASEGDVSEEELRYSQLQKAKQLLRKNMEEYECFPYGA